MCSRLLERGANYSHRDGEKLKNWFNNTDKGKKAMEELRGFYLPLTGTVWVHRVSRERYVVYLYFDGSSCYLVLICLEGDSGSHDRLLPLRKSPQALKP